MYHGSTDPWVPLDDEHVHSALRQADHIDLLQLRRHGGVLGGVEPWGNSLVTTAAVATLNNRRRLRAYMRL